MATKRNTIQKQIILNALNEMNCHASAGMVYESIKDKYPTISKGTVYRVLDEAANDGKVLRLHLCEADDRFDITTHSHYHITCRKCGLVCDVATDESLDFESFITDCNEFEVQDYHLELLGICKNCKTLKSSDQLS